MCTYFYSHLFPYVNILITQSDKSGPVGFERVGADSMFNYSQFLNYRFERSISANVLFILILFIIMQLQISSAEILYSLACKTYIVGTHMKRHEETLITYSVGTHKNRTHTICWVEKGGT